MNDTELDQMMDAANPFDDSAVAEMAPADVMNELRDAIATMPAVLTPTGPRAVPRSRPTRRMHRRTVGAAVALAAAAVAASLVIVNPFGDDRDQSVWAAEALAVAEAVPRYLVSGEDWTIRRIDDFSVDVGEMEFEGSGGQWLNVFWATGEFGSYTSWIEEWGRDYEPQGDATVAGAPAVVVGESFVLETAEDGGTVQFPDGDPRADWEPGDEIHKFVAIWQSGGYVLRAESESFDDVAEFVQVLGQIERVSVDEWLSAMPEDVVRPSERSATVDEMLRDIPVPEGFDASSIGPSEGITERYAVGVAVVRAVTCAWARQWTAAIESGDDEAANQAVAAMSNPWEWDIVLEMEREGDQLEGLISYGLAMQNGDPHGEIHELVFGENDTCGPM